VVRPTLSNKLSHVESGQILSPSACINILFKLINHTLKFISDINPTHIGHQKISENYMYDHTTVKIAIKSRISIMPMSCTKTTIG